MFARCFNEVLLYGVDVAEGGETPEVVAFTAALRNSGEKAVTYGKVSSSNRGEEIEGFLTEALVLLGEKMRVIR